MGLKEEIIRDMMAFGSLPFYLIVVVRVSLLENPEYLFKLVFAGILFLSLYSIFKSNLHLGFGFILLVFLSLHYQEYKFTIMATILYLSMLVSAIHIKIEKRMIIKGVIFGIMSTLASYLMALWRF